MCVIVVNVLRLVEEPQIHFSRWFPIFFTFQNLIINHNYDARCRHRFSSHNDVHRLVCDTLPTQVMRLTAVRSSQEQTGRCRDDRSCWSFFVGNSCVHFKLDDLLEVCIEFPVQIRRDLIFILLIAVSRRLPYDACVLSDLAVKSSGIRASSDLWKWNSSMLRPRVRHCDWPNSIQQGSRIRQLKQSKHT